MIGKKQHEMTPVLFERGFFVCDFQNHRSIKLKSLLGKEGRLMFT